MADGTAESRPFGLEISQAVCDRATRLAKTMFCALETQIIFLKDGEVWRSRDPDSRIVRQRDKAAELVQASGELLWVEDAHLDPRFADSPSVVGPPYLRSYVGVPIRLADGSTPGVLAVFGDAPRAFDGALAGRLGDLAEFVADEWSRAQASHAREQSRRERDAMQSTLAAIVEAMPVALVLTDREMRVIGASPRWIRTLELGQQIVYGRTIQELAPHMFARWQDAYDRVLCGESIKADRLQVVDPSGGTRWHRAELAPWYGADGGVGGLIIASYDITDMIEAHEATERSEQRLMLAMEIADIHVFEMDYSRRELIKTGAEDTFFTEPKTYEELHRDIFSTIDPRDRTLVEEAWREHLRTGEPYSPEYRLVRRDDREVWAMGSTRLISDERGRPLRVIGALQNISERKAAERALVQAKEDAESANRAKSTFLATMSHEIRTPLNGVLGMAQAMAAENGLSEIQRERLEVIRQSGETLLAILNDVLDLSKIEAGKLELEEADFDVAALARGAHAAFTAIANKKGLSFALGIEPAALGVYRGDSTRVRQILYNLVSNALKFTEQGEVRVNVDRDAAGLRLSVSDTGIGIPAHRLTALFQKFEQADASTTRRYGGTGLGLAICRELAGLMGGAIEATSEVGAGTTFLVTLPLTWVGAAPAPPTPPSVEAQQIEACACSTLRVLAAEDNTVNQLVLKTLLHQIGIDPHIVENGVEAVRAWESGEWDVILMDVQMPVMDGPSACALIRGREALEGRERTPIIALTANAMAHQVAEYMAAGMDGFVPKPIEVGRLFEALQQVLEAAGEVRAA
ncbi:ATP-binding protein [Phenylobacterium sp. LjRoot164]|uniref:ATP-binding protein n=1 Tax=unclassified Phenylobacterium TaxID=2640670 RepID=UPI003ED01572